MNKVRRERRRRVAWIAHAIATELDDAERAMCDRTPEILQKLTRHGG